MSTISNIKLILNEKNFLRATVLLYIRDYKKHTDYVQDRFTINSTVALLTDEGHKPCDYQKEIITNSCSHWLIGACTPETCTKCPGYSFHTDD